MSSRLSCRRRRKRRPSVIFKLLIVGNMVFALFVAGWPTSTRHRGYQRYGEAQWSLTVGGDLVVIFSWYCLGAIQIVMAVQQIMFLQVSQYLADISYTFYLVHGPMQIMVVRRRLPWLWPLVGGRDNVLWRAGDLKSVQLARWIETKCTDASQE